MKEEIKKQTITQIKPHIGEKMSRFFKQLLLSPDAVEKDEFNYDQKLKLYERAEQIQSARYLQIDKDKLRIKHMKFFGENVDNLNVEQ